MIRTQVLQKEDFSMSNRMDVALKLTAMNVQRTPVKPQVNNTKKSYNKEDPKLSKALKDFDQILEDFISAPSQEKTSKIPKLQKSKTCCVIESKCVYKRTLSLPTHNSTPLTTKTKSLHDLNKESNVKTTSRNNEEKIESVKNTIRKFTLASTPSSKNLSTSRAMKFDEVPIHKCISRTTSMGSEYCEEKKSNISRIPVITNLRRSFPSTPLGLNKLDQSNGSQQNGRTNSDMKSKFSKSVQNLNKATRTLSLHPPSTNLPKKNLEMSKSVQNLSLKSSKTSNLVSKYARNNTELSKSVHNLNKLTPKPPLTRTSNINSKSNMNLSKSVQNLTKTQPRLSVPKQMTNGKSINSELSKSTINLNKRTPNSNLKKVEHSKSTQNLYKLTPRLSLPLSSDSSVSSKNLKKQISLVDTPSRVDSNNKKRRDFVNPVLKSAISTPELRRENIELKMREMKKVIDAKIDQQLKELSLDDPDEQFHTSVKTKVEQFSKAFEDEKPNKNYSVPEIHKEKNINNIENISIRNNNDPQIITANNCDTFKKKMSAFSCFAIDDHVDLDTPPKVVPRTKKKKKMMAEQENQHRIEHEEKKHTEVELVIRNKDNDVFGVMKHTVEPRFADVNMKNLVQQRKKHFMRNFDVGTNNDDVAHFILKEKCSKVRVEKRDLVKKIDSSLSYGSDDSSSDDSGNISTEIEIDDVYPVDVVKKELVINVPTADQVFLRNGILAQLESQRDECLGGLVVKLQAHCRGYLARKRLSQRKLQDLAVRCIQRNVRKFMLVRDWPWWRLLVRVTPLLNVHRTEEKLKMKMEELESLKAKYEKMEQERTLLKHENDKLEAKMSDMAADLAEEQSAATLATERLEAETGERLRLERELSEITSKNKELNRASERLEMELLYARSDLNGVCEEDDEENDADGGGVYKQRYERVFRELEFTKRRLRQQHEDDLEQLVGLKKQLEKKLNDAYEEAEEQRQVVGQWKNKVQKLNGEMNDLKLLLEEQSARNNLLEKKQRRFDSETQMLNDELKKERNAKERAVREKEVLMTEKYSVETALADTRLELDLKEQKLNILQREYDEITCGERTEEEITNLRRQKIELERKVKDQEEELDELASQVQLLEQAKLRLEMTVESMRKEAKKEANLRDEEMEEMRGNAQKRVKALEAQLENEHEERTMLLRQKHELERRLASAAESERHDREGDEVLIRRLKNDLRKTKALLRDCQTQLDMQKADAPGKNVIRQLKNQVEDLESARALAVKIKQSLEAELSDTQSQLEESNKMKREAEEKANLLAREKSELQSQLEENEEELAEVFKKYKAAIQQMSLDQMALQEQVSLVSELEVERNQLKEQLAELTTKLESAEYMGDASSNLLAKRNEFKVKELESKLDLEQSTRSRLEIQISRLKESVEKLQSEVTVWKTKEQHAQDQIKKLQRSLRETKEELNNAISKEMEANQKRKDMEKRLENLEAEASSERNDLKLAKKRIEDLQLALQGELGDSVSDHSESDPGDSDCDSVDTYLPNNRGSSIDGRRFDNMSRSSTSSSNLGKEASFT